MKYLTFALAKGRLAKKTLELLEQIGITMEEMKDPDTRKLIFVNEELKIKMFLSKASDVPTYVEYGAADIGVVGKDTILEEGRKLYDVMDLGIGKCNMCVCGPQSAAELLKHQELIRVASKYPHIAKDYFYNKKHQTVEIIKLNGSVELAPIVGLSEVIVDIVETGTTLKENGLQVLEVIGVQLALLQSLVRGGVVSEVLNLNVKTSSFCLLFQHCPSLLGGIGGANADWAVLLRGLGIAGSGIGGIRGAGNQASCSDNCCRGSG